MDTYRKAVAVLATLARLGAVICGTFGILVFVGGEDPADSIPLFLAAIFTLLTAMDATNQTGRK